MLRGILLQKAREQAKSLEFATSEAERLCKKIDSALQRLHVPSLHAMLPRCSNTMFRVKRFHRQLVCTAIALLHIRVTIPEDLARVFHKYVHSVLHYRHTQQLFIRYRETLLQKIIESMLNGLAKNARSISLERRLQMYQRLHRI